LARASRAACGWLDAEVAIGAASRFAISVGSGFGDVPVGRTKIATSSTNEASPPAKALARLEGELLVAEGTIRDVAFSGSELSRPTTKRAGNVTVRLDAMRQSEKGIEVEVSVSPPTGMSSPNPIERMQAMQGLQARLSLTLTDGEGRVHEPSGSSSGGGGSSSSGRIEMMTSRFNFAPLPSSATPQAVTCTITDRTGEPVVVPFRFTNIPLPEAGN
jgi:hypothetical protein